MMTEVHGDQKDWLDLNHIPIEEGRLRGLLLGWERRVNPGDFECLDQLNKLYEAFGSTPAIRPFAEMSPFSAPQILTPHAEQAGRLVQIFKKTLFGAEALKILLQTPLFRQKIQAFWEEHVASYRLEYDASQVEKWMALLQDARFIALAVEVWEEGLTPQKKDLRTQVIEAAKCLREHVEGTTGGVLMGGDITQIEGGVALLKRLRVEEALQRVRGPQRVTDSIYLGVEHKKIVDNLCEFLATYPQDLEGLRPLPISDDQKLGVREALMFRLAMFPYSPHHYGIMPGFRHQPGPWNPFEEERLKQKSFEVAHDFVQDLLRQEDLTRYLNENDLLSTEKLHEARMKILLPALKLAQKGARIPWPEGRLDESVLSLELARLNNVLGEMGIRIHRGGPDLPQFLANQRQLTQRVVAELYRDDPEYGNKVLQGFEQYTASPDSFLISIEDSPISSAGEVLIAKVSDGSLTYTVEFLYVDENHRNDFQLGTLLQNIALSLIPSGACIVATAHVNNPNLPRHYRRGWTVVRQQGNTVYLKYQDE